MARSPTRKVRNYDRLAAAMVSGAARYIDKRIAAAGTGDLAAMTARVQALEAMVTDIRNRGVLRNCGLLERGKTYQPGDGVTFRGSYWVARKETSELPEEGSEYWHLAVKRGRDGRDADQVRKKGIGHRDGDADIPGAWRAGRVYVKGAHAIWKGRSWIAQRDTEDQPGTSSSWRVESAQADGSR